MLHQLPDLVVAAAEVRRYYAAAAHHHFGASDGPKRVSQQQLAGQLGLAAAYLSSDIIA